MNILEINNLKKSFGEVTAVNGISMAAQKGEILGMLGPNGAGKSTTISCILGVVASDSGSVVYEGKYSLKKWKQHIGYVPQELAIYDELTAEENVTFFCALYGGKDLRNKVDKALDFVGLTDVRKKKAGTFSGGMKRRLNLACGIAHNPTLIVMDEPTVGIDPQSRNRILENVKKLNENGATILYTTHYMPEAEELCDRLVVVDHGQILIAGTKHEITSKISKNVVTTVSFQDRSEHIQSIAEELKNSNDVNDVSVEENALKVKYAEGVPVIKDIINLSVTYSLDIENIITEEPTLEDIFLTLTGKALRD
ncbi:MAG: ABC transporter ATP-binding protein [Lachnospiraceae bacterium]